MYNELTYRITSRQAVFQIYGFVRFLGTDGNMQQNYDQMYRQYNEKVNENIKLKE